MGLFPGELETRTIRLKQYLATRFPAMKLPISSVIPTANCKARFSAQKISHDPQS
jgi:hypothetical protein